MDFAEYLVEGIDTIFWPGATLQELLASGDVQSGRSAAATTRARFQQSSINE